MLFKKGKMWKPKKGSRTEKGVRDNKIHNGVTVSDTYRANTQPHKIRLHKWNISEYSQGMRRWNIGFDFLHSTLSWKGVLGKSHAKDQSFNFFSYTYI